MTVLIALRPAAIAQRQNTQLPNSPPPGYVRVITVINSDSSPPHTQKQGDDTCLLPQRNLARSTVISTEQLRIPARAKREYQKACSALIKKKSSDAEPHLRKAVRIYPKYAAAWVM